MLLEKSLLIFFPNYFINDRKKYPVLKSLDKLCRKLFSRLFIFSRLNYLVSYIHFFSRLNYLVSYIHFILYLKLDGNH